ncbi:MAG: ATP-binding protein, partial [Bacteroidota bacterium]
LHRLIGEGVTLVALLDPSIAKVIVDPGQIEQVIMNIAVNASDAMPQGGNLTIETRNVVLDETFAHVRPTVKPGKYVMLALSDTGFGMSAETQAHIFEPFFTTKGQGRGTGLGLATVYGIIRQSGGHIEVYSELNMGTVFKIYIPYAESQEIPGRTESGVPSMPRGTETILVVEDEHAVRALARYILTECGYTVLEAGDGHEALQVCMAHGKWIALLVSDVVLPEMSGRAVSEQLSALFPGLKILYMSGYTDDAVIRNGVLQAETSFLQKPFSPVSLALKVREVLDAR